MEERKFNLQENLKDLCSISNINYMQLVIESIDPSTNDIANQILKPLHMLYKNITYVYEKKENTSLFLSLSSIMSSSLLLMLYVLNIQVYFLPLISISLLVLLIGVVRLRHNTNEYNELVLTYVGGVLLYYKETQDHYFMDRLSDLKNPILDYYLKTRTMGGERDE